MMMNLDEHQITARLWAKSLTEEERVIAQSWYMPFTGEKDWEELTEKECLMIVDDCRRVRKATDTLHLAVGLDDIPY